MSNRFDQLIGRLLTVTLLVVVGCSSGGTPPPKLAATVPVTGTVTLDGQPLSDATISFAPETTAGFHGALGRTDASGKYELTTDIGGGKNSKGAIPGKYRITVSKLVKPDGSPIPADSTEPPANLAAMESIPLHYSSIGETKLEYEVPAAGGSYDIPLTSK
jgi:hypothetical protein